MAMLTSRKVGTLKTKGEYLDGNGLSLRVTQNGSKSWCLRTTVHARAKNIGLGSVDHMSLADAREEASRLRCIARKGREPSSKRQRELLGSALANPHPP